MDLLFATKWLPNEQGGGTQQRAAANLRALAACGRVHLLYLATGPCELNPAMAAYTSSFCGLSDIQRDLGTRLEFGASNGFFKRWVHSAWGTSGTIATLNSKEATLISNYLGGCKFDGIFAFHLGSALAANALQVLRPGASRVIDWDFLESPNVVAMARSKASRLSLRQVAAARFNQLKVRYWETGILRRWEGHLCSSTQDVAYLRARARKHALVSAVNNSVPVDPLCPPPPVNRPPTVVFVGSMAYWPNLDAMQHFLSEVWPQVRKAIPHAELQIVGRAPPVDLQARSGCDGVTVYADVPSIKGHYAQAHVAVAPLRFAVGSNLKIPEAMAHGRPVLGYRHACQRHGLGQDAGIFAVDNPEEFSRKLISLLQDPSESAALGAQAHHVALEQLSAEVTQRELTLLLSNIFRIKL